LNAQKSVHVQQELLSLSQNYRPPMQGPALSGNLPLGRLQSLIDRMGGIEGILSMVNQIQKIYQTYQQLKPLINTVVGSFSKTKGKNENVSPSKRRKQKRVASGQVKKLARSRSRKPTRRKN
jgi:hypothetical protein